MPVFLRWLLRLGPLNPIAARLVLNAGRRGKHLYVRAAYLGVLVLVLLWALVFNTPQGQVSYRELAAAGAGSFVWIAYLQIALICILAPVFMAGAIAQEASPRTWEILLTTPMGRAEIVFGQLFGRLFFILALLVASLPLFALTQYFGGVPGRSIFASYLVAACAALLVGAIAIALAVSRLVGRRAVFAFYVSVVTYIAATAAVDAYLRNAALGAGPRGDGVTWLTGLNPFLALRALLNPASYPRADAGTNSGLAALMLERPVTAWCAISGALSVLLAMVSMLTVRSGGLQSIGEGSSGVPLIRRVMGVGAKGVEHRPPRPVGANPIAWREATARNATFGRILARWSFVAAGILFGLGLLWAFHTGRMTAGTLRFALRAVVWTEVAVITLVAINMAATAISREREDGTLDLLLTTPMTPGMYLRGKLRGLIAYLLPLLAVPIVTLLAAGVYVAFRGFGGPGGVTVPAVVGGGYQTAPVTLDIPIVLPEAGLLAPLVLIPFMAFCVMIGLQWSLRSKGTLASVVGAVGVIGAVAGTIGLCAWSSGRGIAVLGPALAALSPASFLGAVTDPVDGLSETVQSGAGGLASARVSLAVGAVAAAGIYFAIVSGLHASMVRNFDFTVRKLAGVK